MEQEVEEPDPSQQGLKQYDIDRIVTALRVEEPDPSQQGLKQTRENLQAASNAVSKSLIHHNKD